MTWRKPDNIECIDEDTRCDLYQFDGNMMMIGYEYVCPKCRKCYRFVDGTPWNKIEIGKPYTPAHWIRVFTLEEKCARICRRLRKRYARTN